MNPGSPTPMEIQNVILFEQLISKLKTLDINWKLIEGNNTTTLKILFEGQD